MKKIIVMLMVFAPMSLFAQKFGHVDSQAIMQGMPEFIQARGEVEAQTKKYEDELQGMQQELQRKSEEYEKNSSTMNDTKRQETEAELQKMYQKMQQAYQDNQQALAKMQQEKMQPITTKLINAIKNVGTAGGYVYIMDTAAGIPYISQTLSKDVTTEVKAELNKLK
ncbi:OmpH family outer membrane protein [Prevotella sp. OH937_COT-195]|uniref:OmpH family outer membrane protein n=1 Tax=Prevotella sp. OH937_COT-195 TaxID=2491051 RepID=UPI000F6537FC|nr:OmpH family outer membrane protein [Prevotella sp. OH937_COT-195]RRD00260.1 OmpH family outer membrane protein [Prevotella sp. OH937_COT-195]